MTKRTSAFEGTHNPVDLRSAHDKLEDLRSLLRSLGSSVTAFSGGVDSSLLAYVAHLALGERAIAVTADSPSLARAELAEAIEFCEKNSMRHVVVSTDELDNPDYKQNLGNRCYFCKAALMSALTAIQREHGSREVLLGVIADDMGDHRPGQAAAAEKGARFPLAEVGLTKQDVRAIAHLLGLPTSGKLASACLSSRIAYGVEVTPEALARVEAAEASLGALGLHGMIRVRDQGGGLARLEVSESEWLTVVSQRSTVVELIKSAGFIYVTLDLEPYRSGSHNAALPLLHLTDRRAVGVTNSTSASL